MIALHRVDIPDEVSRGFEYMACPKHGFRAVLDLKEERIAGPSLRRSPL
jgi:hypothetical protein